MLDRLELQLRAGARERRCALTVGASQFNVLGENTGAVQERTGVWMYCGKLVRYGMHSHCTAISYSATKV